MAFDLGRAGYERSGIGKGYCAGRDGGLVLRYWGDGDGTARHKLIRDDELISLCDPVDNRSVMA